MSSLLDIIIYSRALFLTIPIIIIIIFGRRHIHRHENRYYLFAIFLVGFILFNGVFSWIPEDVFKVITAGGLSFALFYLVMITGAFKQKSQPRIMFMQVRREMALIGFIFLIPHAVYRLGLALNGYNFTGLIAFIIMVPLVIVSYPLVRRKFTYRTWKKIHKLAYVVYLMIYIHLGFTLFLFNGLQISFSDNSILYHLAFLVYLTLKVKNHIYPKIKTAI